jgi:hypothetical protein
VGILHVPAFVAIGRLVIHFVAIHIFAMARDLLQQGCSN